MFNLIKDPKELYPIETVDVADRWFMAPVTGEIIKFKQSLVIEPPILFGTTDPYVPTKKT